MTKINMKDQTIGVEIEMTGITRRQVAEIVRDHTNGNLEAKNYGGFKVTGQDGRIWDIKYDTSINAHTRPAPGRKMVSAHYSDAEEWSPELATPILGYDDIEPLQELIRKLHKAGARSSAKLGCGIHIHIGADQHDARSIRNLVNLIASKQNLLWTAAQVDHSRETGYASKTKQSLVEALKTYKPNTMMSLKNVIEATQNSRYHGLNLKAIWKLGTIEWRIFNGTMHAGEIKSYIQLALAISAQAINQRSASATETITDNPAFTFRTWLIRLGLNGDEFKTCRQHLLKHLPGNKAWRNAA